MPKGPKTERGQVLALQSHSNWQTLPWFLTHLILIASVQHPKLWRSFEICLPSFNLLHSLFLPVPCHIQLDKCVLYNFPKAVIKISTRTELWQDRTHDSWLPSTVVFFVLFFCNASGNYSTWSNYETLSKKWIHCKFLECLSRFFASHTASYHSIKVPERSIVFWTTGPQGRVQGWRSHSL